MVAYFLPFPSDMHRISVITIYVVIKTRERSNGSQLA